MTLYTKADYKSSERIYEGRIFSVRKDTLSKPDRDAITREIVEHNGGVVIMACPKPDQLILIRQYRYPIDEELLELPAGRVELGEDRFEAAKRELIEETGYKGGQWEELPAMYSAPGFCNELLSFYLATDLSWQGKQLDEDEETDVQVYGFAQARELITGGKIRDAKTAAGLAMVLMR